jgi:hypothetical protein
MAAYTTIDNPELYFQTKIYTGDGNDDRNIVFDVTDTSLQPNMLWSARRDSADNLSLYDSVRGDGKELRTAETGAQYDRSDNIQALNSNGFQVGTDGQVNASGGTYVSWAWKESATAGFDILTFEGNSTDDTDISHNLSAVPHWIICRNIDSAKDWCVYHHKNTSAPETDLLVLNTTAATSDSNDKWSDEAPTSSVFTVGDSSQLNASGDTSIAFLWSEKQGYSKFGTYEGNNNASGPYIFLGFKPAWFMTKKSNGSKDWNIYDNKRSDSGGGNPNDQYLEANNAAAEQSGQDVDFLSTGVKIRSTSSEVNGDDNTFIYMAFAESPLVNSNGVPNNAE